MTKYGANFHVFFYTYKIVWDVFTELKVYTFLLPTNHSKAYIPLSVGADNAMHFALGTFQIFSSPPKRAFA